MKPDHDEAKKWAQTNAIDGPDGSNEARAYLDAMARLDKAEKERDGWKDAYFELIRAIGSTPGNSRSPVSIAHELMARLDKATELLARSLDVFEEANIWGTLNDDISAFLERKTDDKQS